MQSGQKGGLFFNTSEIGMSGKLVIKAQLGNDIRCIPILNDDLTYDELLLMMQRVFRGQLSNSDDITIKYKDDDGDLVTIFDSSDLSYAKSMSAVLRITLFVNSHPRPMEQDMVKGFRKELAHIRDRINMLFDQLERAEDEAEKEAINKRPNVDNRLKKTVVESEPVPEIKPVNPQTRVHTAMFDPLKPNDKNVEQFNQIGKQNQGTIAVTSDTTAGNTSQLFSSYNANQSPQPTSTMFTTNQQVPPVSTQASYSGTDQLYLPTDAQLRSASQPSGQNYNQPASGYNTPPAAVVPAQTYPPSSYGYQPASSAPPPSVSAPTQSYAGNTQAQVYIGGDQGYGPQSGQASYGSGTTNPYSRTAAGGSYPQQPASSSGYDYTASGQYPSNTSGYPSYPNY